MSERKHNPGFLALVEEARPRVRRVDVEQLKPMLQDRRNLLLIDVREDHEWQAGHAAGAVHVSKGILERDIETHVPDKERTMVLYCGGGYRSVLAADNLGKMGYRNAISLDGGWRAYQSAGLPVEGVTTTASSAPVASP